MRRAVIYRARRDAPRSYEVERANSCRVHEFDAREGIVPVSAYVGRSEKCGNDGSA